MNFIEKYLGILYPQTCCFCGKVSKEPVCKECKGEIAYIEEPICKKCGKPIRYEENEYCSDCETTKFHYEQGRSVWLHTGKVRWSIYQFKYYNRRIYGKFYAQELFRLHGQWIKSKGIDVIIPVPLHKKKKRLRGYNQSELVARHLGRLMNIPVNERAVIRVRNTKPQKELSHKERRKNLQDAFQLTKHWKGEKNVLLIDDIYTTGNTIDSVAKLLREKGVNKVWFLTISIGQGF